MGPSVLVVVQDFELGGFVDAAASARFRTTCRISSSVMPRPVVSRRRRSSAVLRSALMRSMRRVTAVTDKQVHELGIDSTPQHPETERPTAAGILDPR